MSAKSYLFCSIEMLAAIALTTLILTGCNSVNPYFDPAKPHHTAQGFQNNYSAKVTKTLGDFARWQFERTRGGLPKPPQSLTATAAPDLAFIHANATAQGMRPAMT